MGYGLDTTKYSTRKWSKVITWTGDVKGELAKALTTWEKAVGIKFSKGSSSSPDFIVVWTGKGTTNSAMNQWDNSSKGNGRPDKAPGNLNLTADASLGTVLHEIGHLLGLSHEQDHPSSRVKFYDTHKEFLFGLEGAKLRAGVNKAWKDYDASSVMHYPSSHYGKMTEPSEGDIATVKLINGW